MCHRQSLAIHWLGLGAFTAGGQVQSLVGELRTRKPYSMAKGEKKTHTTCQEFYKPEIPIIITIFQKEYSTIALVPIW